MNYLARKARNLAERVNDWRYHAETGGTLTTEELGTGPDARPYTATPYWLLHDLMRRFPPELRRKGFLDIGCGKGRALLVAARFGFHRVIGVELSERLAAYCRHVTAGKKNIEVVCADAADYPLPADVRVIFLFNPFRGAVAKQVIGNIKALMRDGEERWLVVVNAEHVRASIEEGGLLTEIAGGSAHTLDWHIYSNRPGA